MPTCLLRLESRVLLISRSMDVPARSLPLALRQWYDTVGGGRSPVGRAFTTAAPLTSTTTISSIIVSSTTTAVIVVSSAPAMAVTFVVIVPRGMPVIIVAAVAVPPSVVASPLPIPVSITVAIPVGTVLMPTRTVALFAVAESLCKGAKGERRQS